MFPPCVIHGLTAHFFLVANITVSGLYFYFYFFKDLFIYYGGGGAEGEGEGILSRLPAESRTGCPAQSHNPEIMT